MMKGIEDSEEGIGYRVGGASDVSSSRVGLDEELEESGKGSCNIVLRIVY